MKLSVVNTKTSSANKRAATVVDETTGKDRANTTRFEIYFDGDTDTWYRFDTETDELMACTNRRDCEIEVAIANFDHVKSKAQLRMFK